MRHRTIAFLSLGARAAPFAAGPRSRWSPRRTLHQREGFLKIEHAEGNGQPAFTDEATQGGLVSFSEPILPFLEVGKDLRVEVAEHGRQPASVKTHSLCHSTRRRGVRGVIIACSAPAASRRALST